VLTFDRVLGEMGKKKKVSYARVIDWTTLIAPSVTLYDRDTYVKHSCQPDRRCECDVFEHERVAIVPLMDPIGTKRRTLK